MKKAPGQQKKANSILLPEADLSGKTDKALPEKTFIGSIRENTIPAVNETAALVRSNRPERGRSMARQPLLEYYTRRALKCKA